MNRLEGEKYSLQIRTDWGSDVSQIHIIKYDLKNRKRYLASIVWEELPDSMLPHSTINLDPILDEVVGNLIGLERINHIKI